MKFYVFLLVLLLVAGGLYYYDQSSDYSRVVTGIRHGIESNNLTIDTIYEPKFPRGTSVSGGTAVWSGGDDIPFPDMVSVRAVHEGGGSTYFRYSEEPFLLMNNNEKEYYDIFKKNGTEFWWEIGEDSSNLLLAKHEGLFFEITSSVLDKEEMINLLLSADKQRVDEGF